MEVQRSIVVDRPRADVFAFVTDAANTARWYGFVAGCRQLGTGPAGVGTRWAQDIAFLGRQAVTVIEFVTYEPGRRCSVETVWGPVPYAGTYVCEDVAGGTRLTVTVTCEAGGFFGIPDAVLGRVVGRHLERSLATLHRLFATPAGRPPRPLAPAGAAGRP
jgi:uncharacterized protein YndB with AHSA1/START domain